MFLIMSKYFKMFICELFTVEKAIFFSILIENSSCIVSGG